MTGYGDGVCNINGLAKLVSKNALAVIYVENQEVA